MPNISDMRWFKETFQQKIDAAVQGTPYTIDLMTALACQETGEVWPILRKTDLSLDRILELCVGDTLDAPNRSAFPINKAALIAAPRGQEMFDLARAALVDMAQYVNSYKGAASNPNKFCHAYGLFQYDIQFFKEDPDYFLEKRYAVFDQTLAKAIEELEAARKRIGLQNKSPLSPLELVHICIAYNTGRYNPAKGLKQGFAPKDKQGNVIGPYYGEQILAFMQTAQTVSIDSASSTAPQPDSATTSTTSLKVTASALNVRSDPSIPQDDPKSNVKVTLPNGQLVSAVSSQPVNGFLEVQTDFQGQSVTGFASAQFLSPA